MSPPVPGEDEDMEIELLFTGELTAKARPHFSRGHAFTPKKTRDYEAGVLREAMVQIPKGFRIMEGPLKVQLIFFKVKPKKTKDTHPIRRPDIDNYIKAILDPLNGHIYIDDAQIVELYAQKVFSASKVPCVLMRISEIAQQEILCVKK